MKYLFAVHIGETLGHLARALSVAESLTDLGHTVEIACSVKALPFTMDEQPKFVFHPIPWQWSHNSSNVQLLDRRMGEAILQTVDALRGVVNATKPDIVVGFPGLASYQVALHSQTPHISVIHGPYLATLVPDNLGEPADSIVALSRKVLSGPVNEAFRAVAAHLHLPTTSTGSFLADQDLIVPDPWTPIASRRNIHQVDAIGASIGPSYAGDDSLEGTCYVSFGTGNPCDLQRLVDIASEVFPKVLVSTGHGKTIRSGGNVTACRFVASSSLAGRVRWVICHGGLGTIGVFSASGTPMLVVPTELDQATGGVFASRAGVVVTVGLERWLDETRLGRRLELPSDDQLRDAFLRLRETPRNGARTLAGAAETADMLVSLGEKWRCGKHRSLAFPV